MLRINLIVANKLIGVGSYSFPEPMSSDVCLSDQGTKTKKKKKLTLQRRKKIKLVNFYIGKTGFLLLFAWKKKDLHSTCSSNDFCFVFNAVSQCGQTARCDQLRHQHRRAHGEGSGQLEWGEWVYL